MSKILGIQHHGKSYRMWESPGKIAACMRAGRPYEQPLLEHIYSQKFQGLAVDAGANIGNHTLWMAAVCGLDVVAFEPIKHWELTKNADLNGLLGQVNIQAVALGDTSTIATHVGKGRLHTGKGDVPVKKLDDYGLTNVSMVKIDVEGMEPALLRGAEETIRRDHPVIFAEEWGASEHNAIASVLEPWGYRMTAQFSSAESITPVGRWET